MNRKKKRHQERVLKKVLEIEQGLDKLEQGIDDVLDEMDRLIDAITLKKDTNDS